MAHNMKGAFLPRTSSNSYVKTIASMSDDEICVMLLNRDKYDDFDFDLILNAEKRSDKPLAVQADLGLEIEIEGRIPNQTTAMYLLSNFGEVEKQITYGLKHNLEYKPPEVI